MKWYCPNCEVAGRCIAIGPFKYKAQCSECKLACRIEVIVTAEKTWEEVDDVFQQTALTYKQQFG